MSRPKLKLTSPNDAGAVEDVQQQGRRCAELHDAAHAAADPWRQRPVLEHGLQVVVIGTSCRVMLSEGQNLPARFMSGPVLSRRSSKRNNVRLW